MITIKDIEKYDFAFDIISINNWINQDIPTPNIFYKFDLKNTRKETLRIGVSSELLEWFFNSNSSLDEKQAGFNIKRCN